MDPNLFYIDYERLLEVLVTIVNSMICVGEMILNIRYRNKFSVSKKESSIVFLSNNSIFSVTF